MPDKLIKYAPIPENFDQNTQYIVQTPPVDMGDYIYYGIEIRNVEITEEGGII
jgi:methyl coenzyme M reductase subunit C